MKISEVFGLDEQLVGDFGWSGGFEAWEEVVDEFPSCLFGVQWVEWVVLN